MDKIHELEKNNHKKKPTNTVNEWVTVTLNKKKTWNFRNILLFNVRIIEAKNRQQSGQEGRGMAVRSNLDRQASKPNLSTTVE